MAGSKKVTLELGNNSATIIEADADLEKAAARCVVSAFANSGQVCSISLQRLYVHRDCMDQFTEIFLRKVQALKKCLPKADQAAATMSALLRKG